jgi:hypothetical protein
MSYGNNTGGTLVAIYAFGFPLSMSSRAVKKEMPIRPTPPQALPGNPAHQFKKMTLLTQVSLSVLTKHLGTKPSPPTFTAAMCSTFANIGSQYFFHFVPGDSGFGAYTARISALPRVDVIMS